jgi:hypothetical protein
MAKTVNAKEIGDDFERFLRHEAMRMNTTQRLVKFIVEEKLEMMKGKK